MTVPSENRKYYVVRTRTNADGSIAPDVDGLNGWSARYLSHDIAVVRDPYGVKTYPVITTGTVIPDDLPVQLDMNMTQREADALCDQHGLGRVDLNAFAKDRIKGA